MKNLLKLLICFSLSYPVVSAQYLPDYNERAILADAAKHTSDAANKADGYPFVPPSSVPDNYIIGPGDRFAVSVSGVIFETFDLMVNPEGSVLIPKIGVLNINRLPLSEVKDQIIEKLNDYYTGVTIDVALIGLKLIDVSLIGNVRKPYNYQIPANFRLSNLMVLADGLLADTDLRNVKIKNNQSISSDYDLLSFYRLGDKNNNPFLEADDIIILRRADKLVSIFGEVQFPGIYEYVEGETIKQFIEIAGGFREKSKTDTIEVVSFDDSKEILVSSYYSVEDVFSGEVSLKAGDKVIIRQKPEYMIDRLVTLKGFVKYPGVYKIEKDSTDLVSLILKEAGGFLKQASLADAYIIRSVDLDEIDPEFERLKKIERQDMTEDEYEYFKAKSREKRGRMVVDFEKLFINGDLSENIILKRSDLIVIPEKKDYITIVGQVVNPGNVIFKSELNSRDYIELAGGFSWRALEGDVRIIKSSTGEWIEEEDAESLNPGDIIWVPEEQPPAKFWEVFTTSLTVLGQVAAIVAASAAIIIATK